MTSDRVIENCLKEMFKRVGEKYISKQCKKKTCTICKQRLECLTNEKLTDQKRWYQKRTWSQLEENKFRDWMKKYLKKHMKHLSDQRIESEIAMFILMWGWSIKNEEEAK